MAKGKFTDYIRPIVIGILTIGFVYGFTYAGTIKGDQFTLVYMSVIGFLFGEQNGKRIESERQNEQEEVDRDPITER